MKIECGSFDSVQVENGAVEIWSVWKEDPFPAFLREMIDCFHASMYNHDVFISLWVFALWQAQWS